MVTHYPFAIYISQAKTPQFEWKNGSIKPCHSGLEFHSKFPRCFMFSAFQPLVCQGRTSYSRRNILKFNTDIQEIATFHENTSFMPPPQLFLCNFSGVACFVPLICVHCVASTRNQGKTGGTKKCAWKCWCQETMKVHHFPSCMNVSFHSLLTFVVSILEPSKCSAWIWKVAKKLPQFLLQCFVSWKRRHQNLLVFSDVVDSRQLIVFFSLYPWHQLDFPKRSMRKFFSPKKQVPG